ncbi:solute:sodium symporter family transporter [bacterium]|nr:solute:sodium symporter family transporter [bacterium]
MSLLTPLSFVFFTALVGVITYFLTRGDQHDTSDGYFLAGRTLTGGYIAGSLMLTNLSTEQLVGLNGAAFSDGICVMAWEVIAACSLVIMGLYFLPKYLKSGIATVPEFLEKRFDERTRTITSLIFIVAYAGILLPIILYTGATGLNGILDMKTVTGLQNETATLWFTVWLIGIIGSLYAIFGGLRTVAVSDTINGFGLLVGGILIAYLGLQAVSPEGPVAAFETLREAHPEKFNSLGGAKQSVPFSTLFTGVLLLNLFYWSTNQQIIQRTFGASSLKEGQKGVLLAGCLKVLAPIILVLPGIIAFHLYGADPDFKGDHAYGTLVRNVLPDALAGFFAAVMVGAILSSFNSALNSTATLFSLGVYQHMLHPDASEQRVIWAGKVFGCVIAVASMTVAPLLAGQDSIFGYLQKMNGLYFIPIFSVMLIGLLTRRVPAAAANVALIVGFAAISVGYFVPVVSKWLADHIHDFHFLGAVFAALIVLMLLIGQISPRETPWEQQDAGAVDLTPWPLAKPCGAALVLFVLGLYVYFADTSILGQ